MQEPQLPPITEKEYTEARAESQNREFLDQLKRKNKLPHTFGNRKQRRKLESQIKKGKIHG